MLLQLPTAEEIDALVHDRKLTAIVYFLDETFEELTYDVTTTVLEAVEELAGIIKLQNYTTFTLYESRRVSLCCSVSVGDPIQAIVSVLCVMPVSWTHCIATKQPCATGMQHADYLQRAVNMLPQIADSCYGPLYKGH